MQVAIDNAKRRFDIDLTEEIDRIKSDMNIKENGYPAFWSIIRRGFNKSKINYKLKCPMNYIFNIKVNKFRATTSTLPMSTFFVKYELDENRRKSKKVEELIQAYSLELYNYNVSDEDKDNYEDYLLLRSDFESLIDDLKQTYLSKNYLGLMSWLIDRAFCISVGAKRNKHWIDSTISTNKSILLKVLYDINSSSLLKCFANNKDK